MVLLFILLFLIALAALAPRYGVDSRDLHGGPTDPPTVDSLWSRIP